MYNINKQQYLETLSWMGCGGKPHGNVAWRPSAQMEASNEALDEASEVDMEEAARLLKRLERFCSPLVR